MNITIIQEKGHHEINEKYKEAISLAKTFESLGHTALVWGDRYRSFYDKTFEEIEQWSDVLFIVENYNYDWLNTEHLYNSKKLKLFWTIDSHLVLQKHLNFSQEINTDIVFVSTKSLVSKFSNAYWLPNCVDHTLVYPKPNIAKNINFGFCGSPFPSRSTILNYLVNNYSLHTNFYHMGEHMVDAINSYKLHFNININIDINYRTFETTACNTALITSYSPSLEELFDLQDDIFVYHTESELYSILDKLSYSSKDLSNTSTNGYNNTINRHTYVNRCKTILDIIQ